MSKGTEAYKKEIIQYRLTLTCDYCGKMVYRDHAKYQKVKWGVISVHTEFNSYLETDICPDCMLKKGIKTKRR